MLRASSMLHSENDLKKYFQLIQNQHNCSPIRDLENRKPPQGSFVAIIECHDHLITDMMFVVNQLVTISP